MDHILKSGIEQSRAISFVGNGGRIEREEGVEEVKGKMREYDGLSDEIREAQCPLECKREKENVLGAEGPRSIDFE